MLCKHVHIYIAGTEVIFSGQLVSHMSFERCAVVILWMERAPTQCEETYWNIVNPDCYHISCNHIHTQKNMSQYSFRLHITKVHLSKNTVWGRTKYEWLIHITPPAHERDYNHIQWSLGGKRIYFASTHMSISYCSDKSSLLWLVLASANMFPQSS